MRSVAGLVLLALVLGLLPASVNSYPQEQLRVVGSAWILAPAVSQSESGYVGSATNISVFVTEGWGDVYVSTYSLTQEDFQGAATTAARVACSLAGLNFSNYNFYFKVASDAVIIGGPSAGVAMTVVAYSALTGKPVNRSVGVTGMISPDGTVGPVGGVFEKAQALASSGAKLFLVPPGQSVVTTYKVEVRRVGPFQVYSTSPVTINLTDYALRNWGLRVVEVSTIEEALRYFFGVELRKPSYGLPTLSDEAAKRVAAVRSELEGTARAELSSAREYVNKSTLTTLTKRALLSYLDSYASSPLSTAASRYRGVEGIPLLTSSIAASRWVKLLVDYAEGRNLDSYVSSVRENIYSVSSLAESAGARDFLELNYKVLAADLVVRASRLFNSSASKWSSDPQSALMDLAYASALLDEARLWLEGLPSLGPSDYSRQASTYISIARTTWPYVYSVLSQAGYSSGLLDYAGTYYTASLSLFSSKRYFLAAVAAARSIALAEAAMLDFQEYASSSRVYVETSSRRALEIMSSARDLLVSAYFYNQSLTATTDSDKLAFLKLATELGSLTVDLSGWASPPETQSQVPASKPTQPPPQAPQQPSGKSIWDTVADWLRELYLRVLLLIDSLLKYLSGLLKR